MSETLNQEENYPTINKSTYKYEGEDKHLMVTYTKGHLKEHGKILGINPHKRCKSHINEYW